MNNLAPIVLFTYNRPALTEKTIKALQKNFLAEQSDLFIYSDGAKNKESRDKVNEVRKYLKSISGFKKIHIIEQEKNLGLANSIISGITDIINKYGKVIVLEDDIVTSPYFLKYMNKALNFYEKEEKVWHISGWNYPIEVEKEEDTFLWRVMNCWGWGTWKKNWMFFKKDIKNLLLSFNEDDIKRFNLDNTYDFWAQVIDNEKKKIDSWAIFWYATIFKNNGLCLNPAVPYINNIGFGSESTHCKHNKTYIDILNKKDAIFTSIIKEHEQYTKAVKKYMNTSNKLGKNKRFKDKDYELLRNTSRFKELKVDFLNYPIKIADSASTLFLNKEIFELEIYKFHTNNNTPLIIDCGANIGFSVIYFKNLYPNSKIIAFEPDPKIFKYLQFNINSFSFKNIDLINKGIWKEEKRLNFHSEGADAGRISDLESENIITIETVKLSDYLKNSTVDFLKIDIEGVETDVLIESEKYLKNVENIFIEYHSFSNQKQTLSIILDILEKNNFRYYIEHIGIKSKHPFISINTYEGFDNQLNIFGYKS